MAQPAEVTQDGTGSKQTCLFFYTQGCRGYVDDWIVNKKSVYKLYRSATMPEKDQGARPGSKGRVAVVCRLQIKVLRQDWAAYFPGLQSKVAVSPSGGNQSRAVLVQHVVSTESQLVSSIPPALINIWPGSSSTKVNI